MKFTVKVIFKFHDLIVYQLFFKSFLPISKTYKRLVYIINNYLFVNLFFNIS